jgi:hypothetical protein
VDQGIGSLSMTILGLINQDGNYIAKRELSPQRFEILSNYPIREDKTRLVSINFSLAQ